MAGMAAKGGLNAIDQNLDLVPFDSISNPNRSVRGGANPNSKLPKQSVNPMVGGQMRPEIDSFYNDRNDVKRLNVNK
jgi:hypothetical protein